MFLVWGVKWLAQESNAHADSLFRSTMPACVLAPTHKRLSQSPFFQITLRFFFLFLLFLLSCFAVDSAATPESLLFAWPLSSRPFFVYPHPRSLFLSTATRVASTRRVEPRKKELEKKREKMVKRFWTSASSKVWGERGGGWDGEREGVGTTLVAQPVCSLIASESGT